MLKNLSYLICHHLTYSYEGRSFNCGTGVLQGALWDLSIFHSFQSVGVSEI